MDRPKPDQLRVRLPPRLLDAHSFNRQDAGLWIRQSWFESTVGSHASVAHLAERPFRTGQAGGSRPSRGSMRSWRNGIRAGSRCQWSARAVQVQILSDALMSGALNAALAHLAERPSCKGQATRSRRVGGSTFRDRLIGKTQRFGRCRCWSESSSRNYASLAQWQSVSSVRTRRRIGTCRRLRVTVVSAASTRPCQGLSASSNLVGHSMRWWRNADALVPGTSGPEGS